MKDLFRAVYDHYTGDPLSDSLTAMYNTEAPYDAEFPYAIFSLVSNTQDFTFTEDFENCLVQIDLFSDKSSPEEICNLYELLKGDPTIGEGFDFLELSIENYETVSLVRENATLIRLEGIWQYTVTYRVLLEYTGEVAHEVTGRLYNLLSI